METTNFFDSLLRGRTLKPRLEQHGKTPRRNAKVRPANTPRVAPHRPWLTPAMLELEDRVVRMREEEHLTFKQIARQLGKYPDRIRNLYARALRHRGRVRYTDPATFGSLFAYYKPARPIQTLTPTSTHEH